VARFVERIGCPLCAESRFAVLRRAALTAPEVWDFLARYYEGRVARSELEGGLYEVRRCDACGFLWQAWHLDDAGMQRLYEEWISAEQSLAKKTQAEVTLFDGYAREASAIARRLGRRPCEIRVLDFGMGWGAWCRMAQAYGYDVAGYELSRARQQYARAAGIRVVDSLDALGRYDFVNCHHALEHVPDPLATLARLVAALAPGGIVRLSVPDGAGMEAALQAPDWRAGKDALHPLEHLNCFTSDTLARLAERAGLRAAPDPAVPLRAVALRRRLLSALRVGPAPSAGTTACFAKAS
jgi:SAM-dependent methyltransferase